MTSRITTYLLIILSGFILTNTDLLAQDFSMKSFVNDNQIKSTEYVKYTVETNKKVTVNPPNLTDFTIVQGPYSSSSSSVSIINGKIDRTETYTLTYLLAPNKSGELLIPPSTTTFKGKGYQTKSIKINVGSISKNGNTSNSTNQNVQNSNLFAKINLSKSSTYMGENILVTYKIYTS